ncbi:hypothetical protein [Streptomyces sp. NPDC047841]|uniref:hypothetical protein n=1 Tax=Streptomyces sp. NPDC047841 TaxID=3154708 RepID=UPI003451BB0C
MSDGRCGDQPHPPLLLVFNRVGPRNPNTVIPQLAELTRRHWQGEAHDGFHMYDGKLPIVVTGMKLLKEHGPAGDERDGVAGPLRREPHKPPRPRRRGGWSCG